MIEQKKIAMLFPWAGDEKFRNPKLTYMINGLGYLKPQLQALVNELIHKKSISRIAIFHADDDFSTQAAQELMSLLKKEHIVPLVTASYNRLTVDITSAANKIIEKDPKIIISLGTSMPTVDLINYMWAQGYYGIHVMGIDSTLFVNTILSSRNVPFTFTSPVPDPLLSQAPLAQEYRKQLAEYAPEETYNILSFSYFLSAALVVKAFKECNGYYSKEKLITAFEQFKNSSCGGIPISFDPSNRHVFGTEISIIKG
jgi:ABC-type branched-subunit amino acid transport system substrate-binding protein